MSDFLRNLINETLNMEDVTSQIASEEVEIPDFVPKDKYVLFANNALVAVGESPSDVTLQAAKKGIQPPYVIKFNGKPKLPPEYVFASFSKAQGWKYTPYQGKTYPLLLLTCIANGHKEPLIASIDTAATVCVLKETNAAQFKLVSSRSEEIWTSGGVVTASFYAAEVKLLGESFPIEFIIAPIPDDLPFQFLIGRNLLDLLDAFFFGKKKAFWLRLAELSDETR